ncbi:flagellar export chaperone FlgN [Tepidibacter aestuarii]|uniref:flagellar export chaperone FlgN n=1 Tax=Tepidibacter aestuarii TaxID=2925782 RepID=UPI0020BFC61D|nr:flagellar export chaperone FlgN [Tepidibacter aestuarii]CAH2211878.1 FlgN factor required for flagellar based motility [Tepidibacter aestuarii]
MKSIDSFIQVLNEELIINKILLEISIQKKDLIINNKSKELSSFMIKEQNYVKRIIELEKLRAGLTLNIQKELGIQKITNIKEVIEGVDKEKSREVDSIAKELRTVLKDLQHNNNLNNKLLGITLEYLDLNINLLTSRAQPKTYGKSANEQKNKDNTFFDAKY